MKYILSFIAVVWFFYSFGGFVQTRRVGGDHQNWHWNATLAEKRSGDILWINQRRWANLRMGFSFSFMLAVYGAWMVGHW